jgi:hypothetical protein
LSKNAIASSGWYELERISKGSGKADLWTNLEIAARKFFFYLRGHSNITWHSRGEGGVYQIVTWHFSQNLEVKFSTKCHRGRGLGSKMVLKIDTSYLNGPLFQVHKCKLLWQLMCWIYHFNVTLFEPFSHTLPQGRGGLKGYPPQPQNLKRGLPYYNFFCRAQVCFFTFWYSCQLFSMQ